MNELVRRAGASVLAGLLLPALMSVGCSSDDSCSQPSGSAGEAGLGGEGPGGASSTAGAAGDAGDGAGPDAEVPVWGVGESGEIWFREADRWQLHSTPVSANLHTIWGTGPDDIWAAGDLGALVHYDGETWQEEEDVPQELTIRAIHGTASDDVWAAGDQGSILHFDGSRWQPVEVSSPDPITEPFLAVWAVSAEEVWFGGPTGKVFEWDGNAVREHIISALPIQIDGFWSSEEGPLWAIAGTNESCTVSYTEFWAERATLRDIVLQKRENGWVERYASMPGYVINSIFGLAEDAALLSVGPGSSFGGASGAQFWNGERFSDIIFWAELGDYGAAGGMWGTDLQHLWGLAYDGVYRLDSNGATRETDVRLDAIWGPGKPTGCADECPVEPDESWSALEPLGCPEDGCVTGVCDTYPTNGDWENECFCPDGYQQVEGGCAELHGCETEPCGSHGTCDPEGNDGQGACQCNDGYLAHQNPLGCVEPIPASDEWLLDDAGLTEGPWNAFWDDGPDDIWVVGGSSPGIVAHRGPEGWTTQVLPWDDGSGYPLDVTGTGPDDVWILYRNSDWAPRYSVHHFDGNSWLEEGFNVGDTIGMGSGNQMNNEEIFLTRAHADDGGLCVSGAVYSYYDDEGPGGYVSARFWYEAPRWWVVNGSGPSWWTRVCGEPSSGSPGPCDDEDARTELEVTLEDYSSSPPPDPPALDPQQFAPDEPLTPRPALRDMVAVGGEVWALGEKQIGHNDGASWTWFELPNFVSAYGGISVSPSGIVHMAYTADPPHLQFVRLNPGGTVDFPEDSAIGLADSDGIWQGQGAWVRHWNGSEWVNHRLEGANVTRVEAASNQSVWAIEADQAVIHSFDGESWTADSFDDLSFTHLLVLAEDNVWVASSSELLNWDGSEWQRNDLPLGFTYDFCVDGLGRPWVIKQHLITQYGVAVLDGGEWTESYIPPAARPTHIACGTDRIWVGGSRGPFAWRAVE